MRLVLLGPPGAGKGTQAKVLSQNLNLVHLSTGDIFREAAKKENETGRRISAYMQQGQLVPDAIVSEVVFERLKDKGIQDRFILDGYPRTELQAVDLDKFLRLRKMPLDIVIYMETSTEVILSRLTGRIVCAKCGAIYHEKNMPPKQRQICDKCGGGLIQREDDRKETVLKRIKVYERQTAGLIDYYKNQRLLCSVSGDLEAEKLYKALVEIFNGKGLL